jgi:DNA repair exonuclease SbcCD nuclease subunit
MKRPYGLSADLHCHNWSQFSRVNTIGVNSRLQTILSELLRMAKAIQAAGGDTIVIAGDLFHVRGAIDPSVFNPTFDMFKHIADKGINVKIIPGNHDLSGLYSDKLGNAMQQLDLIDGIEVIVSTYVDDGLVMIPWIESLDDLRKEIAAHVDPNSDLIIHAPLNGVIKGIPDLGLTPEELAAFGYKRVFVGHYHNHKQFDGEVYSIGASTHQTWSDPGTVAGFLVVDDAKVTHVPSKAPSFINLDDHTQLDRRVTGNYVRIRYKDALEDQISKLKGVLSANGCLGWVDHSSKQKDSRRGTAAAPANLTLEASVSNYVDVHLQCGQLDKLRIAKDALDTLTEARMAGDE